MGLSYLHKIIDANMCLNTCCEIAFLSANCDMKCKFLAGVLMVFVLYLTVPVMLLMFLLIGWYRGFLYYQPSKQVGACVCIYA